MTLYCHDFAHGAMEVAVKAIDGEFGSGFAKKNPALVAAFMQSAATIGASESLCSQLSDMTQGFHAAFIRMADGLESIAASDQSGAVAAALGGIEQAHIRIAEVEEGTRS